jgi:hypothetical protein
MTLFFESEIEKQAVVDTLNVIRNTELRHVI